MNHKPDILFINPDFPAFPGWGGHDYLILTHLTRFAKVGLVSQVHSLEQSGKAEKLSAAGISLYLWENPILAETSSAREKSFIEKPVPAWRRFARQTVDVIRASLSGRPIDTFVQDFNLRNLAGPFLRAIQEQHWDVLVIVQSSHANWLDSLPYFGTNILILHDVRTLVYERQAKVESDTFKRWLLTKESARYRKFEQKYINQVQQAIAVSPADELWVKNNFEAPHITSVSLPVSTDYFSAAQDASEIPNRIVFTGMMNHAPNVDAAMYFARDVLPIIKDAVPSAEFWIVGRDPSAEVNTLQKLPGVTVTGTVTDIRPYIDQAAVIVVPIRFGAGMRNKILEAWAMQKCVISTSVGAEGLEYKEGDNIEIGNDSQTLALKIIELLKNPKKRATLKRGGRFLVTEKHNPLRLSEQYFNAINGAYAEKVKRPPFYKALIDLRWMIPAKAGGIETVSRILVKELMKQDRENEYTLLLPPEARHDFDLEMPENYRALTNQNTFDLLRWKVERRIYKKLKLEYWRSPEVESLQRLHNYNSNVVLSMPGYIHPELYPLRNVLVVPDIQHEYLPEFFSADALRLRKKIYTESIMKADYICAISEFTRQCILEKINVDPEKVGVVPLAFDPFCLPDSPYRNQVESILKKYGLPFKEYLFLPGKAWPHKNHKTALQALKILRDQYRLDLSLVCTGSPKNERLDLRETMGELGLDKNVHFLGYVPARDLPGLYEGAAALTFPSLFEGFGMPLLEAMACECPVVCSNTTSLPEIAGDAALMCDPRSPEALADALNQMLTNSSLRNEYIARGRQQMQKFTWANYTAQILAALQRVACD
jgi:glycosyltransferase involved in cell wall biosynthesis